MHIKPIHTEDDYSEALRHIEMLMDAEAGTPNGDLLEILATLVEAYERKAYPVTARGLPCSLRKAEQTAFATSRAFSDSPRTTLLQKA